MNFKKGDVLNHSQLGKCTFKEYENEEWKTSHDCAWVIFPKRLFRKEKEVLVTIFFLNKLARQ